MLIFIVEVENITVLNKEEIIGFESQKETERRLDRNYSVSKGIWLRMFEKNSGANAINGPEALDAALCYG